MLHSCLYLHERELFYKTTVTHLAKTSPHFIEHKIHDDVTKPSISRAAQI